MVDGDEGSPDFGSYEPSRTGPHGLAVSCKVDRFYHEMLSLIGDVPVSRWVKYEQEAALSVCKLVMAQVSCPASFR